MTPVFLTGLAGSLILVTGAAWPDTPVKKAVYSAKNWLFAVGGAVMFLYALMNYMAGGPVFFLFLEGLVVLASLFMMLDIPDTIDTPLLVLACIGLVVWSLLLFEGFSTLAFILGLSGIGLGYAMDMVKREVALTLGSALIALFSYVESSWIFFWLNVFFSFFSCYYLITAVRHNGKERERRLRRRKVAHRYRGGKRKNRS